MIKATDQMSRVTWLRDDAREYRGIYIWMNCTPASFRRILLIGYLGDVDIPDPDELSDEVIIR
ncbi:MAG: hypothetical protein ACE5JP_12055 [Candidatus Bipolaricaulia bacterium]